MASVDDRGQIVVSAERFYPKCQNKKQKHRLLLDSNLELRMSKKKSCSVTALSYQHNKSPQHPPQGKFVCNTYAKGQARDQWLKDK